MSLEVLITRRQSIFDFFANPGRGGPQKAGASWCWLVLDAEACLSLDLQKNYQLSGPQGTSNFDHQSLIHSDLNYTSLGSVSGGFSRSISFKNWSKNRFFVKTTYLEWHRNHSEHSIWSGIKFPVYRDPQTAIWAKIGGFRFKSHHREQILLLLLECD